ncbi:MAG TPA: TaqI-like C-terminal specificity domain-containing protein [Polyangia bacterium]
MARRAGRERKALGAYYTPPALVEAALAGLPAPRAGARGRVVDLACGEGVWLEAVARRWPGTALTGVDIDEAALAVARQRVQATLIAGDGTRFRGIFDCVVGNPPWGAGRVGNVRRGAESVSAFIDSAVDNLAPGGRLCLLVPAAWLEVAAHAAARRRLCARAAIERLEYLGDVFAGVHAPAALLVARREPDAADRAQQIVAMPRGPVAQAALERDPACALNPRLTAPEHALTARLDAHPERLTGRVRFILGVVTGDNRRALGADDNGGDGEPIVTGRDVQPMRIATPRRRLCVPLERVQQAAPRQAYARPKVVYRFVAAHPVAAVDRKGRLTLNSANALAFDDPGDFGRDGLDFVAAWLNSSTVRWLHRARFAMPRVLRSHLERLPLPSTTGAERRAIVAAALAGDARALDLAVMDAYRLDDDERMMVQTWPRS